MMNNPYKYFGQNSTGNIGRYISMSMHAKYIKDGAEEVPQFGIEDKNSNYIWSHPKLNNTHRLERIVERQSYEQDQIDSNYHQIYGLVYFLLTVNTYFK